jgi:hypothetical protein
MRADTAVRGAGVGGGAVRDCVRLAAARRVAARHRATIMHGHW